MAGCGLAVGFWSLAACRMLVGVGEASFVALASPFIGAPPQRGKDRAGATLSGRWFAYRHLSTFRLALTIALLISVSTAPGLIQQAEREMLCGDTTSWNCESSGCHGSG